MNKKVLSLRKRVDRIDEKILFLVKQRKKTVQKIISIRMADADKKEDFAREKEVLEARRENALRMNINPDFIEKLFKDVIKYSKQK